MPGIKVNGGRGWFLLQSGVVWGLYGWVLISAPSDGMRQATAWLPGNLPLWPFGALWIAASVAAVGCGFLPPPRDRAGFMALAGMHGAWSVMYLLSWPFGHNEYGYLGFLVYGALAAAIITVSGLNNPLPPAHDGRT